MFDTLSAPPASVLRRRFRISLVLGMLFPPALVATPVVALASSAEQPADRPWLRAIRWLAILDLLTIAALAILGGHRTAQRHLPPAERAPLGLILRAAPQGPTVVNVLPGSPSEQAGLLAGDVLYSLQGHPLRTTQDFADAATGEGPATRTLGLFREGKFKTVKLTVASAGQSQLFAPLMASRHTGLQTMRFITPFLPAMLALLLLALVLGRSSGRAVPLLILAALVASIAAALFVDWATARWTNGPSWGGLVLSMLATTTTILGFGWFLRRPDTSEDAAPPEVTGWGIVAVLTLGTRASLIGLALAAIVPGFAPTGHILQVLPTIPWSGVPGMLVAAVVVAPLGEELLFRGVLQPWLRTALGARLSIALTAAVFALLHPQYGAVMLHTFTIGCVLGWARERTGSLAAPVAIHAANNAIAALIALASRSLLH